MSKSIPTLLRYPGGKSRAVKVLKQFVPDDVYHVVSPFFGGGSFELYLASNGVIVEGYDLFHQLVFFWDTVLRHPKELSQRIVPYVGNVNKEDLLAMRELLLATPVDASEKQKMETAVAFYIVNRCSFSGSTLSGGFSQEAIDKRFTRSGVSKVESFNAPHLSVSHDDYSNVIGHKTDLLFLDPPYALGKGDVLYGVNGSTHKGFDHTKFRDDVLASGNRFLLTYNNSEDIIDLWKDHGNITPVSWAYGMNSSKKSSEVVITNY